MCQKVWLSEWLSHIKWLDFQLSPGRIWFTRWFFFWPCIQKFPNQHHSTDGSRSSDTLQYLSCCSSDTSQSLSCWTTRELPSCEVLSDWLCFRISQEASTLKPLTAPWGGQELVVSMAARRKPPAARGRWSLGSPLPLVKGMWGAA